jgi:hypothetical protein
VKAVRAWLDASKIASGPSGFRWCLGILRLVKSYGAQRYLSQKLFVETCVKFCQMTFYYREPSAFSGSMLRIAAVKKRARVGIEIPAKLPEMPTR